jgi:hypothetical protein
MGRATNPHPDPWSWNLFGSSDDEDSGDLTSQIRNLPIRVDADDLTNLAEDLRTFAGLLDQVATDATTANADLSIENGQPSPFGDRKLDQIRELHTRLDDWYKAVHGDLTHVTGTVRGVAESLKRAGAAHLRREADRGRHLDLPTFTPRGGTR